LKLQSIYIALLSFAAVCLSVSAAGETTTPDPWPQWRGPERSNVSKETGLLKEWPEGGPPLIREIRGIGAGIAAVAVAGGRIYALGYIGNSEFLTALDERTGQRLWAARVGPNSGEMSLMRWLGQRTPTVDGDRVYAFHNKGQMVCFETQTGKELWRKDYVKEFGMRGYWGFCDRPLVDGDKLICTPGGTRAAMVALNKRTGEVIWESIPMGNAEHAATVICDGGGVRQYTGFVLGKAMSFRASDGKLLWTRALGRTANSCTPIVWKDYVLLAAGYAAGLSLLKLSPEGDGVKAEVQYDAKVDINTFQDSGLMVGPYLYCIGGAGRTCVEAETGKIAWGPDNSTGPGGKTGMTYADGHLYMLHMNGTMALVQATPEKFLLKSKFAFPGFKPGDNATNPVIANGRLYLRQEDRLLCYDVREPAVPEPKAVKDARPEPERLVLTAPPDITPAAPAKEVYVPTPQDVVEKMLELAEVRNSDVVYDLGSGDGRIVVTAAKNHGCKAVGYELDEELVKLSLQSVEKSGVKERAAIERKDVLTVDLSLASVVTVYFSEQFLEKLKPQFEKLKPGSRIVSHQFLIPGATPDKKLDFVSPHDGVKHALYLWTAPLKTAAK
jgi:outer membrane protein assembly factor BamB